MLSSLPPILSKHTTRVLPSFQTLRMMNWYQKDRAWGILNMLDLTSLPSSFINFFFFMLNALDTFGNCQRPVNSHLVYPNNAKNNKCVTKFDSTGRPSCNLRIMIEKHPCCTYLCDFKFIYIKASDLEALNIWLRNYLFIKNFVTSEGASSHILHVQIPTFEVLTQH